MDGLDECRLIWPVHVLAPRVQPLTRNDDAAENQLNQQQQQERKIYVEFIYINTKTFIRSTQCHIELTC